MKSSGEKYRNDKFKKKQQIQIYKTAACRRVIGDVEKVIY